MNNSLLRLPLESTTLSSSRFVFSVFLSFTLSFVLAKVYKHQSHSLSNPETLARVFPLLSISTTLIIAVVKSSLALSLGLVGALSIVRFRTPIKEPEELTYIFLSIGIGLAAGADQYMAAFLGLFLSIFFVYLYNFLSRNKLKHNFVRIAISGIKPSEIQSLIELVSSNCIRVTFNNMSIESVDQNHRTTISLSILPEKFNIIDSIANEISQRFPKASLNIVDNKTY